MRKAGFFIFLFPLLISTPVFAADIHVSSTGDSNVSVNSQTTGESTTCINGKCETTGGESKTTVCVNGKCTESDGNVDINENNVQVKVNNNTNSTTSVKSTSNSTVKTQVDVKTGSESGQKDKDDTKSAERKEAGNYSVIEKIIDFLKDIFPFF